HHYCSACTLQNNPHVIPNSGVHPKNKRRRKNDCRTFGKVCREYLQSSDSRYVSATHGSHLFPTDSPQNAQRENQGMGLKAHASKTIDGFLHGATPIRPSLTSGNLSYPNVERSEEYILILIWRT